MRRFFALLLLAFTVLAGDPQILAQLKAKMRRSKLRADKLEYTVKDGTVEWRGNVAIPQRKGAATRMAKAAGAKRVVNHIRVLPNSTAKPAAKPFQAPREVTVRIPRPN
jgi:hypothetical protein